MSERPALEESVVRRAVERYGRTDPSPDDVLMEAWPRYGELEAHTKGYHEDYSEVMRRVQRDGKRCRTCGEMMPGAHHKRRYCDPCQLERKREVDREYGKRRRSAA